MCSIAVMTPILHKINRRFFITIRNLCPSFTKNYLLGKVEGVLLSFGTNFISDHSFHYNKFNAFEIHSEKIEKPLDITLSRS